MTIVIAVALAVLALTDCVLCGFRAAAGREGRLEKYPFYKEAVLRSFGAGIAVVVAHAILVAALVWTASDPASEWQTFLIAGRSCVLIYALFATAIFAAFAFYFAPIADFRVLTNVIVFGPFTLARPWVIAGGLVAGIVSAPDARVVIVAVSAGIAMLGFQRAMDKPYANHWRRLVED